MVLKSKEVVRSMTAKAKAMAVRTKIRGKEHPSFAKPPTLEELRRPGATADGALDEFDLKNRSDCAARDTK